MKRITPYIAAIFAGLLVFSSQAFTQALVQVPLSEVRDQIVFPELSPAEKRTMAEQAQIFLRDLYVHRYEKLAFYPLLEDPVPAINQVVENIDELSTTQMEEAIYQIFVSQRDLHLNYLFPAPYSTYQSFLPLTFTRTASDDNFFEVRVASVNPDFFERFAPDQPVPEVGDLVLRYNNMPIRRAVREQLKTAQGANRFGGFSRALGQMTFVPHRLHLVPDEDEIAMTLQDQLSGKRYRLTLPWITQFRQAAPTFRARSLDAKPRKFTLDDFTQGVDLWQDLFNGFVSENGLQPQSVYPSNPSAEPVLTWGIIENAFGKFGYLNLSSFVPQTGTDAAIAEIERLVFEEFADTTGLIFDVRNNGGGNILFADALSQLFMPGEAQAIGARLLNTDLNLRIFNETDFGFFSPQWTQVINDAAGTGAIHTQTAAFTSPEQANRLGQIYYQPVAVLNNARSYSATDLFSCAMQDNNAALLYGEDPRTGAGGANVLTHNFFNFYLPEVFEALPLGHAMRVSWRQSVRFGPSEGRVIEDFGCRADIDVSQTQNDLLNGNETQIEKITKSLFVRSVEDRYRPSVRSTSNTREVFVDAESAKYTLFVENTDLIRISINGVPAEEFAVWINEETAVDIDLAGLIDPGLSSVVFEGFSYDGTLLWNLKRQFISLDTKVIVGEEGFEKDFSLAEDVAPFTILNRNPPEFGWNLVDRNLQIGYAPTYVDNVNSDAVVFLDLRQRDSAELVFDMEYDTEIDFDFIEVFATDAAGNTQVFLRESGAQALATYTFDMTAFAGMDDVTVHFRFTSDGFVVAPGVKLQRVQIR